jgi:hypothetical protein
MLFLSGSYSYDPDDKEAELKYSWTCEPGDEGVKSCFD